MVTQKPDLTRVWANGAPPANVVDPDTTTPGKVNVGWQAEVPPFEHFNFLQKWFTQGLAHFNEQGIGVWDIDTTYPIDGLAKGSDGKVYIAVSEQNGNNPTSDDGSNWKIWTNLGLNSTLQFSDVSSILSSDILRQLADGTLISSFFYNTPVITRWRKFESDPGYGFVLPAAGCFVQLVFENTMGPEHFGSYSDLINDDLAAWKLCVEFANEFGFSVKGSSKQYLFSTYPGSQITVKTTVDFNGAELHLKEGVKGNELFVVEPTLPDVIMPPGVISAFQSTLYEGAIAIPPLASTSYENHFLLIESDEILAHRQGTSTDYYKTDPLILLEDGNIIGDLLNDLRSGNLTITAKPLMDAPVSFGNCVVVFDYDTSDGGTTLCRTARHGTTYENISIRNDGILTASNPRSLLQASNVAYLKYKNIDASSIATSLLATYVMSYSRCVDVEIDNVKGVNGWGQTNSNWVKEVRLLSSNLNRLDSHIGIGNVTIKDSTIHGWGAQMAYGRGTISLDNVAFKQTNGGQIDGLESCVRWRADTGLGYRGKVVGKNIRVIVNDDFSGNLAFLEMPAFTNIDANPTVDMYMPDLDLDTLTFATASGVPLTNNVKFGSYRIGSSYDVDNQIHLPDTIDVRNMKVTTQEEFLNFCVFYAPVSPLSDPQFVEKDCLIKAVNVKNNISKVNPLALVSGYVDDVYFKYSLFDFGFSTSSQDNSNVTFKLILDDCVGSVWLNHDESSLEAINSEIIGFRLSRNVPDVGVSKFKSCVIWPNTKNSDTEYFLQNENSNALLENCEIKHIKVNGVNATTFDPGSTYRIVKCYITAASTLNQTAVDALWETIETDSGMYKKPTV